jgi:hypothetical protein
MGTVTVNRQGVEVVLDQRHFVARGAEGAVYAVGDLAYKVYHPGSKVLQRGKFQDLSALKHSQIVTPNSLLMGTDGAVVGYSMEYLNNTWPLCQLFTRAFQRRHNLTWSDLTGLVANMSVTLGHIHAAGMCVVDLNDLNTRVDNRFNRVFFIDVDSWQTPRYPATAVMDSIRDRHAPAGVFTPQTDWFSFAILAFQMLVGVHPYKGTHPSVLGLDARMEQGISVFDPAVRLPPSCRALSTLPLPLKDWFMRTFEHGERSPPPPAIGGQRAVTQAPRVRTRATGVIATEVTRFDKPIHHATTHHGHRFVLTPDGVFRDRYRLGPAQPGNSILGFSARRGRAVLLSSNQQHLKLHGCDPPQDICFDLQTQAYCEVNGHIFLQVGSQILALVLQDVGSQIVATTRPIANILAHATTLFDGVATQDMMGQAWVVLLSERGESQTLHLPELDGRTIVDASHDRGVLLVSTALEGGFTLWRFRVASSGNYDVHQTPAATPSVPSFVTLDTGVCVSTSSQDALLMFHAHPGSNQAQSVPAPCVRTESTLLAESGALLMVDGDQLVQLTLSTTAPS